MGHAEHDDHGHGAGSASPTPPAAPVPTPPHVFAIARATHWLGLGLAVVGFLAAWILLWQRGCVAFAVSGFVSLYGLSVWLAARDTLARPL